MEQSEHRVYVDDGQEQDLLARVRAASGSIPALFELQAYYKEQGQYDDEIAILKQLLEKDLSAGNRAEALHDLAYALYRQEKMEEAISCLENLLDAYPNYRHLGSVFWLLGVLYANRANRPENLETWRQDMSAAERSLKKALDHIDDKEERAAVLVELGAALGSNDRLAEARCVLQQALDSDIEDPATRISCYQRLGRIFRRLGQVEQAKRRYEQAVLICPEKPDNFRALAYVDLAGLHREQGKILQAERFCNQARQVLDESSPHGASVALESIYEESGDIAFRKGKYQQAADDYQAALGQSPLPEKRGGLNHKLGVALQWDGQYERALESLRQALALEISSQSTQKECIGELLLQMGQCAYGLHDFQQAILLLGQTSDKVEGPMLAEAHLSLGHSYFRLKRFKKATEFYGKVIKETRFLSPNWRQAARYWLWARVSR